MIPPAVLVVTDRLDQILAPPREIQSDLQTVFQKLYERQYTGKVILHFRLGVLEVVEPAGPKIRVGSNGSL